jgi:hypothetical protein
MTLNDVPNEADPQPSALAWFVQVQSRIIELNSAYPPPEGMPALMWSMVLTMASQQDDSLALRCLKQGRAWSKADLGEVQAAKPRRCFENAATLALADNTLTYVEGYGCTEHVGLAMHHAWVVDPRGTVLDPTWRDGVGYCGLPFKQEALKGIVLNSKVWGVFDGLRVPQWVLTDSDRWLADVVGRRPGAQAPPA